jgi:hypothetical protein
MLGHPYHDLEKAEILYRDLLQGKQTLNQAVLDQLKQRTVHDETRLKPLVRQGREILKAYFRDTGYHEWLASQGVGILFYGSLQYNDPRNLDADVTGIALNAAVLDTIPDRTLLSDLMDVWEINVTQNRLAVPHTSWVAADMFADLPGRIRESEFFCEGEIACLAEAITGLPLFSEDEVWMTPIRQRMRQVAESHPLMTAIVNLVLQDCLDIRLARERG